MASLKEMIGKRQLSVPNGTDVLVSEASESKKSKKKIEAKDEYSFAIQQIERDDPELFSKIMRLD